MIKKLFLVFVIVLVAWASLAACAPQGGVQKTPPGTEEGKSAELANPASVNCEEKGNRLEIRTAEDGSQVGICIFPDGSECEEWAYYRGECGPGSPPAGGSGESPESLPTADPEMQQKVVEAARVKLAERLKVEVDKIVVSSAEPAIWRDACLDLPMKDEMCAAVITPGFRIVLTVDGTDYVFHTDETGNAIRQELK